MWRRLFSPRRRPLRKTHLLSFAIGAVLTGCATPPDELPVYEPAMSGGALGQAATIEGSVQAIADARTMIERPYLAVCAYVFAVDGRIVGPEYDCAAAIPISPGKHTVVVAVDGYRFDKGRPIVRRATTTLTFDAAEAHRYKVSTARASVIGSGVRADVWISDETTRTAVTETRLATMPQGPIGSGGIGVSGF
jgi:hypothetical protein